MRVIDPGHKYALHQLDSNSEEFLIFVKRTGEKYPGNTNSYQGTNIQEVCRALIDRLKHLNNQDPDHCNEDCIGLLRSVIRRLERRAARRHHRGIEQMVGPVEHIPFCKKCGHIGCPGNCH